MREKKRKIFYLIPNKPRYKHKMANIAELCECNIWVYLPSNFIYISRVAIFLYYKIILVVYLYSNYKQYSSFVFYIKPVIFMCFLIKPFAKVLI